MIVVTQNYRVDKYDKNTFDKRLGLRNYHSCQVLEYRPEPWDEWVSVGDIQVGRGNHAILSIEASQLPCLAGEDDNTSGN